MQKRDVAHVKRLSRSHYDAQRYYDNDINESRAERPGPRRERRLLIPLETRRREYQRIICGTHIYVYDTILKTINDALWQKQSMSGGEIMDVVLRISEKKKKMKILFIILHLVVAIICYPSSDALYGRDQEVKHSVVIVEKNAGSRCKVKKTIMSYFLQNKKTFSLYVLHFK